MIPISEFNKSYINIREKSLAADKLNFTHALEFMAIRFPETNSIFKKLDNVSVLQICQQSEYIIYEENQKIFAKGEECNSYIFILHGDMNLYEGEFSSDNKLFKSIAAGTLYGHKIKSNYKYTAVAKNTSHILKISKLAFDNIIEKTNKRKDAFKMKFLKKYFPRLRTYTDDVLTTLKGYFIREKYYKQTKIFFDGDNDEYCYLIINGEVGLIKSTKKIKSLKEKLEDSEVKYLHAKYVILEKLNQGEIFGMYSALKHHKNNHTAIVLSEELEVYKISKSHILYYFGGSMGFIPETLRGIDQIQQSSMGNKLKFLQSSDNLNDLKKFEYIYENENEEGKEFTRPILIDETVIENGIKDAWKEVEDLESKISMFKANLLKGKGDPNPKGVDILSKMSQKEDEVKDHTKLMGFGTNRVVGRNLNKNGLTNTQMKGINTLKSLCGEKQEKEDYLNKIASLSQKSELAPKNRLTNFDDDDKEKKATVPISEGGEVDSSKLKKKPGLNLKQLI